MIGMVGYIFILQYIVDSTDGFLNGLEESFQRVTDYKIAAENKNAAMASYQNNLIELIRSDMLTKQSMEDIYEIICKSAAKNLQINRVSVWLLSDDKSKLIRKYLYENGSEEKTQPVELESDKYPNYFEALLNKPYIKATNAFENKETSDFTESYLKPLQIYSMLDCPIIIDGKTVGVICCENKFMQKKWQTEDILYTQSLSDYIAIAFKNEQIKNLINQIKIQNAELLSKNSEIESMNSELCTLNEELRSTNDMLEETVRARTLALETQNKQLMEYAFINSHLLRAPLSRILGISNLIITEIKQIETMELLEALVNSTKELDGIVRKISLLLQDGNNLTREDIETILHKNNLN
jgi:GAF domain-containing protein